MIYVFSNEILCILFKCFPCLCFSFLVTSKKVLSTSISDNIYDIDLINAKDMINVLRMKQPAL